MIATYIIIGIVAGLLLASLYFSKLRTLVAILERELQHQKDVAQQKEADSKTHVEELKAQHIEQIESLKEHHRQQLDSLKAGYSEQQQKAESQYKEALVQMHLQHEKQMQQQMQLVREQMSSDSEKILKARAEQLSQTNKEQLAGILTPLQVNIQQMREAVEKSDREQTATMQRLDASIKTSFQLSREVGERADKLAQALTGENTYIAQSG